MDNPYMKKLILTPAFVLISSLTMVGCNAGPNKKVDAQSSELEKVGYSFGYAMGEGNRELINDLDVAAFTAGFKDAYGKKDSTLTKDEMQKVLLSYKQRREKEMLEEAKAKADNNLKEGKDWLAKNGKKEGVKTTDTGLQYKVVKAGTGKSPKATDTVEVHYEGRLLDGTVFDSSKKRGQTAKFPLNQVIAGWTEGLQLMKEGGEYQFYIPASLAYGETGNQSIAPNSTLIFDVELIKVNP